MIVSCVYAKKHKLLTYFNFKLNVNNKKVKSPKFAVVDIIKDAKVDNRKIYGNYVEVDPEVGEFQVIPKKVNLKTKTDMRRDILYMTGPSGSGKTTAAAKFAKEYHVMYPDNKICFISTINDNKDIIKLDPIFINIRDPYLIEQNWFGPDKLRLIDNPDAADIDQTSQFQDTLVIYDDLESISDKELAKSIRELQDQILNIGRHFRVSCVICKHLACEYNKTRQILLESDFITIFPRKSTPKNLVYLLNKHLGFDNKTINMIINSDSPSVCISSKYPHAIIETNSVYIPRPRSSLKE